jgi:arylsulfatase A-like enzyme
MGKAAGLPPTGRSRPTRSQPLLAAFCLVSILGLSARLIKAQAPPSCSPGDAPDTRQAAGSGAPSQRPNIVYILADDLGYGDVRCLNKDSRIPIPRIDHLARQGMVFTDAHSGSAVCTPTRYGILTGRYAWRSRLKWSVFSGYSPPLIEPGRLTVARLLKRRGYHTACFGKWHLGWDWAKPEAVVFGDESEPEDDVWAVRYDRPIRNGPTALGFDEFFGVSASLDMPPFVFVHNDRCAGIPTVEKTILRKGPAHPDFEAVDALPTLTRKVVAFIEGHGRGGDARPFFVYFPLTAPHTPIAPSAPFKGRSGINAYADFVMQVDATVGAVMDVLAREGLERDTLLIVTSDNGCSPMADFEALARAGHDPSGGFRGTKADIFEGGHRIPFVARWPGRIRPGSTCADPICLTDLMATCAAIVGEPLPEDAGEDSVNLLPDLLGEARGPLREATVHHSINGSFAIRQGPWKLALCADSGGWSFPRPGLPEAQDLPPVQLYNLERDPAERHNVQAEHPEIVARLTRLLKRYINDGRSTPTRHR